MIVSPHSAHPLQEWNELLDGHTYPVRFSSEKALVLGVLDAKLGSPAPASLVTIDLVAPVDELDAAHIDCLGLPIRRGFGLGRRTPHAIGPDGTIVIKHERNDIRPRRDIRPVLQ